MGDGDGQEVPAGSRGRLTASDYVGANWPGGGQGVVRPLEGLPFACTWQCRAGTVAERRLGAGLRPLELVAEGAYTRAKNDVEVALEAIATAPRKAQAVVLVAGRAPPRCPQRAWCGGWWWWLPPGRVQAAWHSFLIHIWLFFFKMNIASFFAWFGIFVHPPPRHQLLDYRDFAQFIMPLIRA